MNGFWANLIVLCFGSSLVGPGGVAGLDAPARRNPEVARTELIQDRSILGRIREVLISEIALVFDNSMLMMDLDVLFDLKSLGSFSVGPGGAPLPQDGREVLVQGQSVGSGLRSCNF